MLTRLHSKQTSAAGLRFGIVAARYNVEFSDALLSNCLDTLAKAGADTRDIQILRVPGSFEVTAAAAKLAKGGKHDCVIGLGILLQGETRHAQYIANAVAHGLTNIAIQTGVPTIFGIVAANNPGQARVRCVGKQHNRGREAALAGIEMARLWKSL
ncbi:MAG TPA: 6,7-dimethyl-8-ribityllumazine synthase [Verrucomicrobiae bacterium]|nr:6,7-dimethyl-8-ribityllumazine synthase [Verrucomicrobiae bacterium]